jgi:hypothetical protein
MSLEDLPAFHNRPTPTHAARAAYTVNQFCEAHSICRTRLYALWTEGRGPRFMRNGARRLITAEAAADWRRQMENAVSMSPEAA